MGTDNKRKEPFLNDNHTILIFFSLTVKLFQNLASQKKQKNDESDNSWRALLLPLLVGKKTDLGYLSPRYRLHASTIVDAHIAQSWFAGLVCKSLKR